MSLLHTYAPQGRMGEGRRGAHVARAVDVRSRARLYLGAIGSSLGLVPVFWSVGVCMTVGGFVARRGARAAAG